MLNLRNVYDCPTCGEVTRTEPVVDIDVERDEVGEERVCSRCGRGVRARLGPHGEPTYVEASDEELWLDTMLFGDEDYPGGDDDS